MLLALEGGVGYGMGGARVEIEVGYERFPIQGVSGGKGDDGDAVFLLAKELANDIVRDQTAKLSTAIAKVTRKEMHIFAEAVKIEGDEINKKICKSMAQGDTGTETANTGWANGQVFEAKGVCACPRVVTGTGSGELCKVNRSHAANTNWKKGGQGNIVEAFKEPFATSDAKVDIHTAEVISEDVIKLGREEKSKVASAFARTIEGAEVKNVE